MAELGFIPRKRTGWASHHRKDSGKARIQGWDSHLLRTDFSEETVACIGAHAPLHEKQTELVRDGGAAPRALRRDCPLPRTQPLCRSPWSTLQLRLRRGPRSPVSTALSQDPEPPACLLPTRRAARSAGREGLPRWPLTPPSLSFSLFKLA